MCVKKMLTDDDVKFFFFGRWLIPLKDYKKHEMINIVSCSLVQRSITVTITHA